MGKEVSRDYETHSDNEHEFNRAYAFVRSHRTAFAKAASKNSSKTSNIMNSMGSAIKIAVAGIASAAIVTVTLNTSLECRVIKTDLTSAQIAASVTQLVNAPVGEISYMLLDSDDGTLIEKGYLDDNGSQLAFLGLNPSCGYELRFFEKAGDDTHRLIRTFYFKTDSPPKPLPKLIEKLLNPAPPTPASSQPDYGDDGYDDQSGGDNGDGSYSGGNDGSEPEVSPSSEASSAITPSEVLPVSSSIIPLSSSVPSSSALSSSAASSVSEEVSSGGGSGPVVITDLEIQSFGISSDGDGQAAARILNNSATNVAVVISFYDEGGALNPITGDEFYDCISAPDEKCYDFVFSSLAYSEYGDRIRSEGTKLVLNVSYNLDGKPMTKGPVEFTIPRSVTLGSVKVTQVGSSHKVSFEAPLTILETASVSINSVEASWLEGETEKTCVLTNDGSGLFKGTTANELPYSTETYIFTITADYSVNSVHALPISAQTQWNMAPVDRPVIEYFGLRSADDRRICARIDYKDASNVSVKITSMSDGITEEYIFNNSFYEIIPVEGTVYEIVLTDLASATYGSEILGEGAKFLLDVSYDFGAEHGTALAQTSCDIARTVSLGTASVTETAGTHTADFSVPITNTSSAVIDSVAVTWLEGTDTKSLTLAETPAGSSTFEGSTVIPYSSSGYQFTVTANYTAYGTAALPITTTASLSQTPVGPIVSDITYDAANHTVSADVALNDAEGMSISISDNSGGSVSFSRTPTSGKIYTISANDPTHVREGETITLTASYLLNGTAKPDITRSCDIPRTVSFGTASVTEEEGTHTAGFSVPITNTSSAVINSVAVTWRESTGAKSLTLTETAAGSSIFEGSTIIPYSSSGYQFTVTANYTAYGSAALPITTTASLSQSQVAPTVSDITYDAANHTVSAVVNENDAENMTITFSDNSGNSFYATREPTTGKTYTVSESNAAYIREGASVKFTASYDIGGIAQTAIVKTFDIERTVSLDAFSVYDMYGNKVTDVSESYMLYIPSLTFKNTATASAVVTQIVISDTSGSTSDNILEGDLTLSSGDLTFSVGSSFTCAQLDSCDGGVSAAISYTDQYGVAALPLTVEAASVESVHVETSSDGGCNSNTEVVINTGVTTYGTATDSIVIVSIEATMYRGEEEVCKIVLSDQGWTDYIYYSGTGTASEDIPGGTYDVFINCTYYDKNISENFYAAYTEIGRDWSPQLTGDP